MRWNLLLLLLAAPTAFALSTPIWPHRAVQSHRTVRITSLRACADSEGVDSSGLYASLQKRRSILAARHDRTLQERKLVADLAAVWPKSELAVKQLWQHWYDEEGDAARAALEKSERVLQNPATAGEATELLELLEEYPDWAEPVNRLATLRYLQGDFEDSITLCKAVLRMKPWHFGALGGLVGCYSQLGDTEKARRCANEAMPQESGRERNDWVQRNLEIMVCAGF